MGCSYIPYHKLITMSSYDLDSLEEGGMIDEETVPEWLRGMIINVFLFSGYCVSSL